MGSWRPSPAASQRQASGQATYIAQPQRYQYPAAPTRQQSPPPQQRQQRTSRPGTPPAPEPRDEAHLVKSAPLSKNSFLGVGLIVLVVICALPIWDAAAMLNNVNYAYWGNRALPMVIIAMSAVLIALFFLMTEAFYGRWAQNPQTSQTLVMTASMFVTLVGLMLVLVSLPLAQNAVQTHNDISYNCLANEQSHMIHEEYEKLLSLRKSPACASHYTIEACDGFVMNSPHATYLKAMENTYRCTGFCHEPTVAALTQTSAHTSDEPLNLLRQQRGARKASLLQSGQRLETEEASVAEAATMAFPPALFSTANYTSSCDGAAARHMINFTRDIAYQMWYMGIILIALSMCMGLWEWTVTVTK